MKGPYGQSPRSRGSEAGITMPVSGRCVLLMRLSFEGPKNTVLVGYRSACGARVPDIRAGSSGG
jgi:hypothetical protein